MSSPQDLAPESTGASEWPPERGGAAAASDGGPPRRRGRWLLLAALVAVALAAATIVLFGSGDSHRDRGGAGIPPGQTTATVTRRTLTESATVDGTLGYGATLELYDRLAGTFTWLPAVGAVVERGGTLFKVDDQPVVLMYGSLPAYRTLKEGVSEGPDVAELNQNLIDLGYDPYGDIGADSEAFGAGTAAAVRRWQHAEGLSETGEVELGRVVFAPSARRITDVHVGLGQDPPPAEGATAPGGEQAGKAEPGADDPTANGSAANESPKDEPVASETANEPAANEPTGDEPAGTQSAKKEPAEQEPAKKEPAKKNSPASRSPGTKKPGSGSSPAADKGDTGEKADDGDSGDQGDTGDQGDQGDEGGSGDEPAAGGGTLVLSTTSTQQLVQLKLKAEQQQLAHLGERAPVTLPSGDVAHGRVIEVGTVASESKSGGEGEKAPSGESGESATVPVTLALDRRVPRLDDAPVSVVLVKSVRHDVLTVPATALTALAGGRYAVQVLEGRRRRALVVTPGMFADGYVQVQGAGLREGLTVLQSE